MNLRKIESKKSVSWLDNLNDQFRARRRVFLAPILRICTEFGVTGNFISNLRILLATAFLALWLTADWQMASAILVLFILLLDLLDGPLSHHQNKNSDRGKFIDIFADHVIYSFILLALLKLGGSPILIVYNLFAVSAAYLLGAIKKEEFKKSDWIIRAHPRLSYLKAFVVLPFFLEIFFDWNVIQKALIASAALATILSLYYLVYIQLRWRKVYGK